MVAELEEGRQQQIEGSVGRVEMLAGIMGQGFQTGMLRSDVDPKEMARAYLGFQNGLIHLWLTSPNQFSLKNSADSFADILMAGLQNQAATAGATSIEDVTLDAISNVTRRAHACERAHDR